MTPNLREQMLLRGQVDEALNRFRSAMAAHQPEMDKSFASAAIASGFALALYESNELDALEALTDAHLSAIADSTLPDWMLTAFLAAARGEAVDQRPPPRGHARTGRGARIRPMGGPRAVRLTGGKAHACKRRVDGAGPARAGPAGWTRRRS